MEVTAMESIKRFLQDDSGIAATEYVVLAALITGALVIAVTGVGTALGTFFTGMATWIGLHPFGG
jgi:pilus assembly protein Flp/PilA